jgi:hypothetical protein
MESGSSGIYALMKDGLPQDMTESEAIAALILSATNDENPKVSLDQIYSTLAQSRMESHLVCSLVGTVMACQFS